MLLFRTGLPDEEWGSASSHYAPAIQSRCSRPFIQLIPSPIPSLTSAANRVLLSGFWPRSGSPRGIYHSSILVLCSGEWSVERIQCIRQSSKVYYPQIKRLYPQDPSCTISDINKKEKRKLLRWNPLVKHYVRLLVLQPVLMPQFPWVKVHGPVVVKLPPALSLCIPHQRNVVTTSHRRPDVS